MEKEEFERLLAEYQAINKKTGNFWIDNPAALIAYAFTIFTFAVYIIVLCRVVRTSETTTTVILTSVTNMEMLVLGYYFVSSKTNKDRDKQIVDLMAKNEELKTTPS